MGIVAGYVEVDDDRTMDYMLYPEQQFFQNNWLAQQVYNVSEKLTDAGRAFLDGAKNLYETIHDSETIRKAQTALRLMGANLSNPNTVQWYNTLEQIQNASVTMQPYIMANPVIGNLYQQQLCDGYSETFVPYEGEGHGEDNYLYRRIMDGVVVHNEDTDEYSYTNYYEDTLEGEREMGVDEVARVLTMWEIVEMAVENHLDPTNPDGGTL